jgi:hypothetical protein
MYKVTTSIQKPVVWSPRCNTAFHMLTYILNWCSHNDVCLDLPSDASQVQWNVWCSISPVHKLLPCIDCVISWSQCLHVLASLPSYAILYTKNYKHILGLIHNKATQTKFFYTARTHTHTHTHTTLDDQLTWLWKTTNRKQEEESSSDYYHRDKIKHFRVFTNTKYISFLQSTGYILRKDQVYCVGGGLIPNNEKNIRFWNFYSLYSKCIKHSIPFVLTTQQIIEQN